MNGDEVERLRAQLQRLRAQTRQQREDLSRLRAALDAERRRADQWREVAEERRVTLERVRQRLVVRFLLWMAEWVRPPLDKGLWLLRRGILQASRVASAIAGLPHRLTAGRRLRELRRALSKLHPPLPDTRSVSVIVLTRDGREHLEKLLPALRRTAHEPTEVIVFDNGSRPETRDWLDRQEGIRVLRSDTNLSFSIANNRAAAQASGEVLCFLNDDVEPLDGDWLDRMLGGLADGVGAVGAQLVYPKRPLVASTRTRDVGVQHRGVELDPVPGGVPQPRNAGGGADPHVAGGPDEVAAATAACLLVPADVFAELGGFDERYVYGAEDVDLCWRMRRHGLRVLVVRDAVLFHDEGATRHREEPSVLRERQGRNWDRFAERFGPELARATTLDRLRGEMRLASRPYEVAITITRDMPEAGYGDWYTAHELGRELKALGWTVRYIEKYRDAWYELPDTVDAVVVLLDTFDLRKVARPGLTTIAWIRNWTERWISAPWFDDFDLVLASGEGSARLIRDRSRQRPIVFPLATNPRGFEPEGPGLDGREGPERRRVVFTGNYWGRDARVDGLVAAVPELEVYGKGWEDLPTVAERWHGHLDYNKIPALYRESLVVVDQAAMHTRNYGSVNARVFDGLAAGALPVTNQVEGAQDLFGDTLPTYQSPDELAAFVSEALRDPEGTQRLGAGLRDLVLAEHTYAARARRLRELLVARAERPSLVLKTSAPDRQSAARWGDWHLAEALARELRVRGHDVRLQTADEWDDRDGRAQDVAVHLKGRSRVKRAEGQVHVIWNISHPEELTVEECEEADLVLVASRTFPDELRTRVSTPVGVLLQATDERRFHPLPPDPEHVHDVAFVGNSRFTMRPTVRDAVSARLRPAIYGGNWERFVSPDLVIAPFVPNERLPVVYSSVKVLLNDHWEGMRRYGFVSNRIFDALACGACVVSDDHDELKDLFGDAVAVYQHPEDLRTTVDGLLEDPARREEMGARGRELVLAGHTFSHRAHELLEALETILAGPAPAAADERGTGEAA